ncbi:MAG: 2-oxoacid:ferredoxin oxidoreductase subunit alpha [Nitrososphaerales archaeon]
MEEQQAVSSMLNNFTYMVGGQQGSGVDTSANIFAKACGLAGLEIYGKREYHSNIKGMHSYFQLKVNSQPVRSLTSKVDLLASFDEETLAVHYDEVSTGGGVIYDPKTLDKKITSIPTLDKIVVNRLIKRLEAQGLNLTIESLIEECRRRGVQTYPLPYDEILTEISKKSEKKFSELARMINVLAVASSLALVELEITYIERAIKNVFRGKAKAVEENIEGAKIAYEYVKNHYSASFPYKLKSQPNGKRLLLTGNEAIALGKLVGGCRFQSYYPITPAADESIFLEARAIFRLNGKDEVGSIVVFQTEDELAALTSATGAGLAGARAATSTSGPGFSVMVEGLGWAGMNEVPVVVTLYQRGGPSTGLPTRHEQGDLRYALHAGHGEFPRIVIASGDIEEAFYDAAQAFNYAEKYQTVVIHLVDKALANSNQTVKLDPSIVRIERGNLLSEEDIVKVKSAGGEYKRFAYTPSGISPRVKLGTKGCVFWNSGDEHDELGHINENPENRVMMMDKRMSKLELADSEIPLGEKIKYFGSEDAKFKVVSWGSTKGAILDAIHHLSEEGIEIGFLQIKMLCPLPSNDISKILEDSKVIDVEMNYSGQLGGLITEKTGIKVSNYIVKYNGRPMFQDEVYQSLKDVVEGTAPKRRVLTLGA